MQYTVIMYKPELTQLLIKNPLQHQIIETNRKKMFYKYKLLYNQNRIINPSVLKEFYKHVSHLKHFNEMTNYYASNVMSIYVYSGDNAIDIGLDFKAKARYYLGKNLRSYKNWVHASDTLENAKNEIKLLKIKL